MGATFIHRNGPVPNGFRQKGRLVLEQHGKRQILNDKPLEALKALLRKYRSPKLKEMPPFTGGAIGFLDMICCSTMKNCQSMQ